MTGLIGLYFQNFKKSAMKYILSILLIFSALFAFGQADSTATVLVSVTVGGTEPNLTYSITKTNTLNGEVATISFTGGTSQADLIEYLQGEWNLTTERIKRLQERRAALQQRYVATRDVINNEKEYRRAIKAAYDAINQ